ncbi:MAG: D-alanyl-D-alanine carboxypeptidase [Lachnospiraceae bacterium]|nr:D-alanyl-D-alanine carboxypeptidase [Lachnospiraceae bacterium]
MAGAILLSCTVLLFPPKVPGKNVITFAKNKETTPAAVSGTESAIQGQRTEDVLPEVIKNLTAVCTTEKTEPAINEKNEEKITKEEEERDDASGEGVGGNKPELILSAPSVILMEAGSGQVIYEKNSEEIRKPASITKIMTLLLTFEALEKGKIHLQDQVVTSAYAKSMGGSQVFLEEGEVQTVDTLIKCIAVASGNDAAVAIAEHIAGSEEAFVAMMNEKAAHLHMEHTRFEDCCGLTDSDGHVTTAKDVAIMSRELITKYPQIYDYTKIWMEEITHETSKGVSQFTLSSTNKLLRRYEYATGLKTGSTSAAKFCLSATARKNGIDLIAVIMAAPDSKGRVQDAMKLLNYGFSVCQVYHDDNKDSLVPITVSGGVKDHASLEYEEGFYYMDITGADLSKVKKTFDLPESVEAPVRKGDVAGYAVYMLEDKTIGKTKILFDENVEEAGIRDYIKKITFCYLL